MATEYKYQKFPVNVTNLANEIETDVGKKVIKAVESDVLDGSIIYSGENIADNLCITFNIALSAGDKTTLDTTVSNHTS